MSAKGQDLESAIQRYFEFSLFAMIVVAFLSLAGTGKLDRLSLLFVLGALGLRGYQLFAGRRFALSQQTTSRLTLVYVVFYAADFLFVSASFLTATVHLVLFIMVVMMFSTQRDRDHVYLAIISFLMILAAATLTVDSLFLGSFVVFLLLSVSTFISMEMRRSIQAVRKNQLNPSDSSGFSSATIGSADNASTQLDRRLGKSLSSTAIVLVVLIFAGSPLVFYGLPRLSLGKLSAFSSQSTFASGFSDNVELGQIGRIQQSDAVVMHVQFTDASRVPADLKWRGVTLGQFDGKSWSNRPEERRALPINGASGSLSLEQPQVNMAVAGTDGPLRQRAQQILEYRVLMEPIGTNVFFLIPVPLSVSGQGSKGFVVDRAGSVSLADPLRQVRDYYGISAVTVPDKVARANNQAEYSREIEAGYLQLPKLDQRIPELARQITRNAPSTYEKAAALERYLSTKFEYTLQLDSRGDDPLAYFLFTRKKGHCEYFASSMAIMLRTLGIPSRIVNGFRNGELNDVSGRYIVRARDAHSWVEAYIPGFGWATFDPTPAASPLPRTSWSRLLLYMDALREFWGEWVINYDFSKQSTLSETTVSRSRLAFDRARLWFREKYETILERVRRTQTLAARQPGHFATRAVLLVVLLFCAVNLPRFVNFVRGSLRARNNRHVPSVAASIWFEKMVVLLRRRGVPKLRSQTPQEFVQSIPADSIKSRVAQFTDHYERARFGDSVEDAEKLPELFREFKEMVEK